MNQAVSLHVKWGKGISLAILGFVFGAVGVFAQNPILKFSFEGEPLTIPLEGSATAWLRVENVSVYEADGIEIAWLGGPVDLSPVEPIEVLAAFSDTRMRVTVSPDLGAVEGETEAAFQLAYTYCVDDLCFQIVEDIVLPLNIVAAVVPPADGQTIEPPAEVVPPVIEDSRPHLVLPLLVAGALVAALIAGQVWGRRWWVILILFAVLATGLGYGIVLKQDQQAQSIGAVLCTSCVGIEVTPHEDPELSDDARQRIAAIDGEIELLLFTATWCHACPYAKAMAQQAADINPLMTIQIIDVDVDRDAADRYGIIQSGRTIVPAILRVDTGEVVFGIEDLEERLLALLEGSS
jgi:thiol-disulfide isomerase/thioredoxin